MPPTVWSCILEAAGRPAEGWDRLIRLYWKPAYHYIRARFGVGNEEAKDLTQAFFAHLTEGHPFRNVGPEKGSFRRFLKVALKNFVLNEIKAQGRLKRGGGLDFISLAEDVPAPERTSPDEAFEQEWLRCVFQRALPALEEELRRDNHLAYYEAFKLYDLEGGPDVSYRQVAERLGLKPSDVRNYLHDARERLRRIVRGIAADYVADRENLEGEIRQIMGNS